MWSNLGLCETEVTRLLNHKVLLFINYYTTVSDPFMTPNDRALVLWSGIHFPLSFARLRPVVLDLTGQKAVWDIESTAIVFAPFQG